MHPWQRVQPDRLPQRTDCAQPGCLACTFPAFFLRHLLAWPASSHPHCRPRALSWEDQLTALGSLLGPRTGSPQTDPKKGNKSLSQMVCKAEPKEEEDEGSGGERENMSFPPILRQKGSASLSTKRTHAKKARETHGLATALHIFTCLTHHLPTSPQAWAKGGRFHRLAKQM